jgi:mono/diheme cytochrome c family protein/plastocyanin
MTDQPGPGDEQRLPARREPSEPAPVERFAAPPSAHQLALTPERAARIVRQSGSARWVGFLAVLIVVVFVILYYFYELGIPGVVDTSRLAAETEAQAVTSVERGYNIYQTNCSRCHGVNGEGGIGPILNDQMKLATHLTPTYIRNVLTVGGRYVCGNPQSLMPVWADINGGPLNYVQILDLIAFLRATNDTTYEIRDPGTNEPVESGGKVLTFKGWRDPKFVPPADATPVPDCWSRPASPTPGASAGGSAAPSAAPSGSSAPSAAPSGGGAGGTTLQQVASGVQFGTASLEAPANQPFSIDFDNQDAGIPHNIQIADASGTMVFEGDTVNGPAKITYNVPALAAGSYKFSCKWHPTMVGDLTVK